MMRQTKNDTLVLQVEDCADGLVTPLRKINIYKHIIIALTRGISLRKPEAQQGSRRDVGRTRKRWALRSWNSSKGLTLERKKKKKMMMMMMMMTTTTTIKFGF
jgi:hypothetical protein